MKKLHLQTKNVQSISLRQIVISSGTEDCSHYLTDCKVYFRITIACIQQLLMIAMLTMQYGRFSF